MTDEQNNPDSFRERFKIGHPRHQPDRRTIKVSAMRGFPLYDDGEINITHPAILAELDKLNFDLPEEERPREVLRNADDSSTESATEARSRGLVADYYTNTVRGDHEVKPDEVFVTKRAADAIVAALWFLAERIRNSSARGERPKVLLIRPSYGLFGKVIAALNHEIEEEDDKIEIVYTDEPLRPNDTQELVSAKILKALDDHTGVNLVVLNSPTNPLGHIYSRDLYEQIIARMKRRPNLHVFEDMVYDRLNFTGVGAPCLYNMLEQSTLFSVSDVESRVDGALTDPRLDLRRRSILIGGNSKTGATGDIGAIGWLVTHPEHIGLLEEMAKDPNSRNGVEQIDPSQKGELFGMVPKIALRHNFLRAFMEEVVTDEVHAENIRRAYARRFEEVSRVLSKELHILGSVVQFSMPKAGYYFVLEFDFERLGFKRRKLAEHLKEKGFHIPDGWDFGGKNAIRLCAGSSTVRKDYAAEEVCVGDRQVREKVDGKFITTSEKSQRFRFINRHEGQFYGIDGFFISQDINVIREMAQQIRSSVLYLHNRAVENGKVEPVIGQNSSKVELVRKSREGQSIFANGGDAGDIPRRAM